MTDRLKIGLTMQPNTYTGWGIVALGLARALAARPDVELSFWSFDPKGVSPLDLLRLDPIWERGKVDIALVQARNQPRAFDGVLIHADGNHFHAQPNAAIVRAERNMGLMVFEDT